MHIYCIYITIHIVHIYYKCTVYILYTVEQQLFGRHRYLLVAIAGGVCPPLLLCDLLLLLFCTWWGSATTVLVGVVEVWCVLLLLLLLVVVAVLRGFGLLKVAGAAATFTVV